MKYWKFTTIFLILLFFYYTSLLARLNVYGSKTFSINQVSLNGDLNQFVLNHPDLKPGFNFDQKLKLKIDGRILNNVIIKAELDDSAFEKKEITVKIDGKIWDITLGDFGFSLGDTEFTIYNKQLKGIMLEGKYPQGWQFTILATRSMGKNSIYRTAGQGTQQEYRLPQNQLPIVKNSEIIYIDNRQLFRGQDYDIDYEEGIITFNPRVLPIESNQMITVQYEYEETASSYKRTLLAIRGAYQWDRDNLFGLTYVRNADDKGSPVVEIDENSAKPQSHDIIDANWKLKWKNLLYFKGEVAHSRRDLDLKSDDDQPIEGNAHKIETIITHWGSRLDILHKKIDPNFASVGNKGTSVQGGQNWIINDIDQLSIKLNITPFKNWGYLSSYNKTSTNVLNIENKEKKIFYLKSHDFNFKFWKNNSLHLGYRNEDTIQHLSPLDTKKDTYIFEWNSKIWENTLKLVFQDQKNKNKLNHTADLYRKTGSLNVSRRWKRLLYSLGYNIIDEDKVDSPYRTINNFSLNTQFDFNRTLRMTGIFLNRIEKNYQIHSKNSSLTADMRLRFSPNRKFINNLKYKEVHDKKLTYDESNHQTQEIPVTTQTISNSISYRPNRKLSTQLNYDYRNVSDEKTDQITSLRNRLLFRVTVSPNPTLSSNLTYRYGKIDDRHSKSLMFENTKALEIKKSITSTLNMSTRVEWQRRENISSPDQSADTQTAILRLEKRFSKYLRTDMEYQNSKIKKQLNTENLNKFTIGGTISAFQNNLRSRVSYTYQTKETTMEEWKHLLQLTVDYKFTSTTNLHTELNYENVSPTAEGGKGYDATIFKSNLEIQF